MIIEKMQSSHLEQVAEIEKKSFVHPWSIESLKAELYKDDSYFFVAIADEKIVGYMGFNTVLDEAYVANVAVLPQYRGQGIGRALVNHACVLCREMNMSFITLEVRSSNLPAISLYQSIGFKEVGRRKNFYTEPTEDALLMTKYFDKTK